MIDQRDWSDLAKIDHADNFRLDWDDVGRAIQDVLRRNDLASPEMHELNRTAMKKVLAALLKLEELVLVNT